MRKTPRHPSLLRQITATIISRPLAGHTPNAAARALLEFMNRRQPTLPVSVILTFKVAIANAKLQVDISPPHQPIQNSEQESCLSDLRSST
jgi:hypothetical protein